MVLTFNVRYTLPTRSYFSHVAIPSLYSKTRAKIVKDLQLQKLSISQPQQTCVHLHQWNHTYIILTLNGNLKPFACKQLIHLKIIQKLI